MYFMCFRYSCNRYFRPQFKRFAALKGDMSFQAPRRFLLEIASKTQPAYSYREPVMISFYPRKLLTLQSGYMRAASQPILGAAHGFDIADFFGLSNQTDFIAVDSISKCVQILKVAPLNKLPVYFAHKRDPNAPRDSISLLRDITWERWSSSEENPPLLTFLNPPPSMTITSDTYRSDAMKLVIQLLKK